MGDPWAAAAAAIFRSAGSIEATYWPKTGEGVPVRVIRSQPDQMARFGESSVVQATNVFQLLKSDAPCPRSGDSIVVGDDVYTLFGDPTLDVEGTTWNCPADPA